MNRYLYNGVLELEKAQREKYEMDALVAQYGGMSARSSLTGDQATGYLADGLQAIGLYDNNLEQLQDGWRPYRRDGFPTWHW